MKKRTLALVMAATMVASVFAGCGGGNGGSSSGDNNSSGKSLRLVNGKIEVDAQLKELAEAYEKETGTKVTIESMGGGVDIQGQLKNYNQAGNMPDIFVCGGSSDFKNWTDNIVDLSDQEWTKDTELAYKEDGKVYGFPYTQEAIGLCYNADILQKAGIDPKSITGPESMKKAFETLDAKKSELGLTAVLGYSAEPVNLYWSTGNHIFSAYQDGGLQRGDTKYFDMLSKGEIDKTRFNDFSKMVALFNKYSDPALLVSGTYDQQILNFASGKYAFVTQGSWIGATMTGKDDKDAYKAAGNFKCGILPYAFQEGMDRLESDSPSYWAVTKNDNSDAAKKFLQWCAGDAGQQILVEKAGFVSPFKSSKYVASDPFAQTLTDYQKAGKTSGWTWPGNKEGLAQNALGQVFNDFAQGKIATPEDFTNKMATTIKDYYSK